MSSHPGTVAGVYAGALLAVAADRGTTTAVIDACESLPTALTGELLARLDDPRLGKAKAKQVLATTLATAPREIRDLLLLLVDRNRLGDAPAILREAVSQYKIASGAVRVDVTTAVPLTGPALDAFTERIRRLHGPLAVVVPATEPKLIGGFTARIGDQYVDASVRRRLSEMRARMLATQLSDDALWANNA